MVNFTEVTSLMHLRQIKKHLKLPLQLAELPAIVLSLTGTIRLVGEIHLWHSLPNGLTRTCEDKPRTELSFSPPQEHIWYHIFCFPHWFSTHEGLIIPFQLCKINASFSYCNSKLYLPQGKHITELEQSSDAYTCYLKFSTWSTNEVLISGIHVYNNHKLDRSSAQSC